MIIYEGEIFIDETKSTITDLINISWYIGDGLPEKVKKGLFHSKNSINRNSIKEQIEYGVRFRRQDSDYASIKELFEVSSERINRNIEFVGGERWKASAAIGYANGRNIFCYPWMNTKDIENIREQLTKTIKCLVDEGCIVIFPTTKEENIKKIYSEGQIVLL